jgi:hypothetical protein
MIRSLQVRPFLLAAAAAALLASPAQADSAFGCKRLEDNPTLPSVEGKDGFFFRIFADLRMQHPFTEEVTTLMGDLSDALKAHGTTLMYVPIPTKSVTLPTFLPAEAALFGFDEAIAAHVYADQIERLRAKNVIAVDLLATLKTTDGNDPPFFRSDFHWTSTGARKAAEEIGGMIKAMPDYAEVTPINYETRPTGVELAVSGMRRQLQAYCSLSLPPVVSTAFETVEVASADATLDIFGDGPQRARLACRVAALGLDDRVRFCGTLARESLRYELATFDRAILPSRFDGWGMLASEALAAGTPVICTDACGAVSLVDGGPGNRVVAGGRVDLLAGALAEAVSAGPVSSEARGIVRGVFERKGSASAGAVRFLREVSRG